MRGRYFYATPYSCIRSTYVRGLWYSGDMTRQRQWVGPNEADSDRERWRHPVCSDVTGCSHVAPANGGTFAVHCKTHTHTHTHNTAYSFNSIVTPRTVMQPVKWVQLLVQPIKVYPQSKSMRLSSSQPVSPPSNSRINFSVELTPEERSQTRVSDVIKYRRAFHMHVFRITTSRPNCSYSGSILFNSLFIIRYLLKL